MAISINTNMAATRASHFLASNHANLQRSLDRLSSGKRITQPADDAGGLAVAMKLNHSINGLRGASKNISNAISFLQVQDGILDSAGQIVGRMGELRGLYSDVTKDGDDKALYDSEFRDLMNQLNSLASSTFNGIALFTATDGTAANGTQLPVIGAGGTQIQIDEHDFADDINDVAAGIVANNTGGESVNTLASSAYTDALEAVASMRATNGGQVKRLQYALADVETQISNMTAAHGRIMDVDIASESSNLAKQQILVQASAAMTAQANMSNDVALMLLQ